jgi:hypothetical protein
VPTRWCVLTGNREDDDVEAADALLTRVPGLYPSRQSLVEGLSLFAPAGSTSFLALRVDEDIRFGAVWTSFRVTLADRLLPGSLDSRLMALARKLTTGGATRYRPHVESFEGALGRWQRTHTVRGDHEPSGKASVQVVVRHQISLDDRPLSVEVETTTAHLTAAPALVAEVDAVVASMTLV